MPSFKILFTGLFLVSWALAAEAGSPRELGHAPLDVYRPADYRNHPQNWAVLQGDDGMMFFGNTGGVLTFDGEQWALIRLPNGSIVRSLAKGPDGTVWVGGVGELGYLATSERTDRSEAEEEADAPSGDPQLEFHSLVDRIPAPHRRVSDVWRTFATSEGVFFQAGTHGLLRWANGVFRALPLDRGRQFLLEADGRILINQEDIGLMEVVGDSLEPVPAGASVAGLRLRAAIPWDDGDILLATRGRGLLLDVHNVYTLFQSRSDPARVLVGSQEGLHSLRFDRGSWSIETRKPLLRHEVRSIAEDPDGRLWLGTFLNGVFRLELPGPRGASAPTVAATAFGRAEGLPTLKSTKLLATGDELLAATPEGLYRLDASADRFVPDERLPPEDRRRSILRITEDRRGNLWLSLPEADTGSAGVAWIQENGSFRLSRRPFRGLDTDAPLTLLVEDDGVVWMGGLRGVARCEPFMDEVRPEPFSVLIREAEARSPDGWLPLPTRVPFGRNTYRFRVAAPRFTEPETTRYRVLLEGFDQGWSPWSDAATKEYTNLWEGRYTFRVRARDVFGDTSHEATLRFWVEPPWYRTWWAFGLYGVAALAAVGSAARFRSRHLERETARLEALVHRRTAELDASVRELEATTEELKAFSYSVSHDLQAPLRRIRAFSRILLERYADGLDVEGRDHLQRLHSNAHHLRELIESTLELSRVSRTDLRHEPLDLTSMAEEIAEELRESAPERDVSIRIERGLTACGDRNLVELLLRNLLENAWKFTRDTEGAVIALERVAVPEASPRFRLRDNGSGFDPRYADQLFVPFRRLHGAATFEGTGVGLATVQRIVRRHGGSITADGMPGSGAAFTFSLEPEGRSDQTPSST